MGQPAGRTKAANSTDTGAAPLQPSKQKPGRPKGLTKAVIAARRLSAQQQAQVQLGTESFNADDPHIVHSNNLPVLRPAGVDARLGIVLEHDRDMSISKEVIPYTSNMQETANSEVETGQERPKRARREPERLMNQPPRAQLLTAQLRATKVGR